MLLEASMRELTRTFMIPLEQYVARLMPLRSAVVPHKVILASGGNWFGDGLFHSPLTGAPLPHFHQAVPQLKEFNNKDFLSSVNDSMHMLKSSRAGDWLGLYGRG